MLFGLSVSILFTACFLIVVTYVLSFIAERRESDEWTSLDDFGVHLVATSTILAFAGVILFIVDVIL